LDILVNNAGASRVYVDGPATIPDAEWQDSLDVNFLSPVRVVRAALPAMKESGVGTAIVTISSGSKSPPAITAPLRRRQGGARGVQQGSGQGARSRGHPGEPGVPWAGRQPGGTEVLQTVADAMGASLAALAGTVPLGRFGDARATSPKLL